MRVAVLDSVGSRVGQGALNKVYNQDLGLTVTKFVIQTASARLGSESIVEKMMDLGADVEVGLPVGQGAGNSRGDAVLDGETSGQAAPDQIVITTVRL